MRTSWLIPLTLVLAACSTSTTPAQGPGDPATTGTATSDAPSPSASETPFDCEQEFDPGDAEKFEQWRQNCEQALDSPEGRVEVPEPVPFSKAWKGEVIVTEVTKITHPSDNTVALTIKFTNQGNMIPPEVQIDPSAILTYATKKDEKLGTGEDGISLTYDKEAEETGGLDDFDKRGQDLEPKKTVTVPLEFRIPAKYQDDVLLNVAIGEDHKWAFFAGSVR